MKLQSASDILRKSYEKSTEKLPHGHAPDGHDVPCRHFYAAGRVAHGLISHYSVAESIQGFASSAASVGGVVALVSSFFLIGKLSKLLLLRLSVATCAVFLALLKVSPVYSVFVAMWFALGAAFNLHVGIAFCAASTFLCALCCRFAKLPPDKKA